MSKEFKMVPVEPTEEMQEVGCSAMPVDWASPFDAGKVYEAMLAAAPQPPALGGDPDTLAVVTLGCFSSEELGDIDIEPQMSVLERIQQELVRSDSDEHIELIDRAHIAPLQTENAQLRILSADQALNLKRVKRDYVELKAERDQLKARCDELEENYRLAIAEMEAVIETGLLSCVQHEELEADVCSSVKRFWDLRAALSKPAGSEQA